MMVLSLNIHSLEENVRDKTVGNIDEGLNNARQVRILCEAIYSVTLFCHWILSKIFCLLSEVPSRDLNGDDHAQSEYVVFIHRTPTLQNSSGVICHRKGKSIE